MTLQKIEHMIGDEYTGLINARFASIEDELKSGEPISAALQNGTNTITADKAAAARFEALQGRTIVNLVPSFIGGAWGNYQDIPTTKLTDTEVETSLSTARIIRCLLDLKPNTTYTVSSEGSMGVAIFKSDDLNTPILHYEAETVRTFNSSTTTQIYFYVRIPVGIQTIKNPALIEGSEPQPFVQGVRGITNPTITNETNGTSATALTTLYGGDRLFIDDNGKLRKHTNFKEIVLAGNEGWTFVQNGTGSKEVMVALGGFKPYSNLSQGIKHDGKVLKNAGNEPYTDNLGRADTFTVWENGNLYVDIPNADSGWGDTYTPTPAEIKAYFLGWKMYHNLSPYGNYDATDGLNKAWAIRNTPASTYSTSTTTGWAVTGGYKVSSIPNENVKTAVTDTGTVLPLTAWQPYRLILELATPVVEGVQVDGALLLDEGENTIKLRSNDLSATPSEATISYQSNIGGVVEQLAVNAAATTIELNELQRTSMRKGEKLQWINATAYNTTTAKVEYAKDSNDIVHVRVRYDAGTWKGGQPFAILPAGYRPKAHTALVGHSSNLSPYSTKGWFIVLTDGKVIMSFSTGLADSTVVKDAYILGYVAYKAEQ